MLFILVVDECDSSFIRSVEIYKKTKDDVRIILTASDNSNLIKYESLLIAKEIPSTDIIKCPYTNDAVGVVDQLIQVLFIHNRLYAKNSRILIVGDKRSLSHTIDKTWQDNYTPYSFDFIV